MASSKAQTQEAIVSAADLVELLASSSRRARQDAAAKICVMARKDASQFVPYVKEIVDSLKRPEARTRWESLDTLTLLVASDSEGCSAAVELAEESLFDETNGTVRLAAMRFLCKLGCESSKLAGDVWPLVDEALQCYHGDPEYIDMLVAVNDFAHGELPADVREGLVSRMQFDANSPKSGLMRRANSIIEAAKQ